MPNMPNYRLYNLPGSPCDTLGVQPPLAAFWRHEQENADTPLEVAFTDLSYFQPVSWHWDFGDGTGSDQPEPLHTYAAPGVYTVCLTACNAGGVCDTLCRAVQIASVSSPETAAARPGAWVEPNPAVDNLRIFRENDWGAARFQLFNALGQPVREQTIRHGSTAEFVEVASLPAGMYFWGLWEADGAVASGMVMVSK